MIPRSKFTLRSWFPTLKIQVYRTGKCMITKMNITALPQAKADDPIASCRVIQEIRDILKKDYDKELEQLE